MMSLFQTLGFAIGPAIQAALTPVGCSQDYAAQGLVFDMYTVCGWFSCLVGFIRLILYMPCIFKESNVASKEAEYLSKEVGGTTSVSDLLHTRPDMLGVGACLFGFFVFMTNFVLLETIGTPVCMQQLGWDEAKSIRILGILMSIGAVLSLFCFASIGPLTKKIDERLVYIIAGIIPMLASRALIIPMGSHPPEMKHHYRTPREALSVSFSNTDCE